MTKKTLTPVPKTPALTRKKPTHGIALSAAFLLAAAACATEEDGGDTADPDTATGGILPPQPMPTGGFTGTGGAPQPFPQGGETNMAGGGMGGDLLPPQPFPEEDLSDDLLPPQPFPDGDSEGN